MGNVSFKPGKLDAGFKLWAKKGLSKISDLYKEGVLMSFEEISQIHNIPKKHFFKYLQLRSFIYSMQDKSLVIPALTPLEEITNKKCNKCWISLMYNWIVSGSNETSTFKLNTWMA